MRSLLASLLLLCSTNLLGQSAQMVFDLSAPEVKSLPKGAQWMVSLHDANGTLIQQVPFPATALQQRVVVGPQKVGTYTASYYLDLNGNNELDKGLFGQPIEPYAFSNGAQHVFPARRRQPTLHPRRPSNPREVGVSLWGLGGAFGALEGFEG